MRAVDRPRQPGAVVAPRRETAPEVVQPDELLRRPHEIGARVWKRARRGRRQPRPQAPASRSPTCVPFASRALRAVTTFGAANAGPSCHESTQPGYPRASSGDGWSGTAIFVQPSVRTRTRTCLAVEHLRRHVPDERHPRAVGDRGRRPHLRVERADDRRSAPPTRSRPPRGPSPSRPAAELVTDCYLRGSRPRRGSAPPKGSRDPRL